ncbi:MAG: hypothetical protein ABI846_02230 [Rudaea sp.]
MQLRIFVFRSVVTALGALCCGPALAADSAGAAAPLARNIGQQKLGPFPGMPACAPGAVLSGDPGSGRSLITARLSAGCKVPWHWHTPDEQVMLASGTAKVEMKDAAAVMLHSGGYAMMPSRHVHQFTCTTACVIFVSASGAFDIHYVDALGKELTPEMAFKKKK